MADGEVSRETVLQILARQGVTATPKLADQARKTATYVLQHGEHIEEQTFPLRIGRKLLHYLSRKFKVPIHLFFHPESTPVSSATSKPTVVAAQKPKSA